MRRAMRLVRKAVRALGYDVVRFPRESLHGHVATILEQLQINCVLDVGARHGDFARSVRDLGYEGLIVSFEPVRESFAVLAAAAEEDPRWHAHRLALGSEKRRMIINVSQGTHFSSFREPLPYAGETFPESTVIRQEPVDVRRLDDAFPDLVPLAEPRVFLKIDTQGWDLEVLAGASQSLAAVLALQSEVSVRPLYEGMPSYLEAISRMTALGFDLSGLFPVARDDALRVIELDCLMVRSEPAPS